jgi:hypothetical protein
MRQFFDDGSWLDTGSDGSTVAANWQGSVVSKVDAAGEFYTSPNYWTDARESAKLRPYAAQVPGQQQMEWWQSLAVYGATRAIDSHLGPPAPNRTSAPATFAGQNGQTYSQIGNPNDTGALSGGILPLLALGAVAFLALG